MINSSKFLINSMFYFLNEMNRCETQVHFRPSRFQFCQFIQPSLFVLSSSVTIIVRRAIGNFNQPRLTSKSIRSSKTKVIQPRTRRRKADLLFFSGKTAFFDYHLQIRYKPEDALVVVVSNAITVKLFSETKLRTEHIRNTYAS